MLFLTASSLLSIVGAVDVPSCGMGLDACPEEYPCCSSEGTCGNGYVCLGGCDPRFSNTPGACVPMPIFDSTSYKFDQSNELTPYLDYWGDADKQPWNYFGNVTYANGNLRCQMYENGPTTVVSSGFYLWYGKVTVRMKTSQGGGVVSDVILLSGTKDEIDYEMIGNNLEQAQTNYYWQGVLNYHNMEPGAIPSDSAENFHDYTIDWQEDHIDWIIDGNTVRTLNKADTFNSTSNSYAFPQTPSRVQFGLWPGGDSAAQGTSEWAGGRVDWNSADMQKYGYKFIEVESVDVEVYSPPQGTNVTGSKSYVFTKSDGLADSVAITDDKHILGSSDGTGLKLNGTLTQEESSSSSEGSVLAVNGNHSSTKSSSSSSSEASSTKDSSSTDESSSIKDSSSTEESSSKATSTPSSTSTKASSTAASSKASSSASSSKASSSSVGENKAGQVLPGLAAIAAALLI